MNSRVENKDSMYLALLEFFANHLLTLEPDTGGEPGELAETVGIHSTKQGELRVLIGVANENTSGYTTQKAVNRATMQAKAVAIAGALFAYFKKAKDERNASKAYTTASGIGAMRDTMALYYSGKLHTLAAANAAPLVARQISEAYVATFATDIANFEDSIEEPKDVRGEKKAANQYIEVKINEIDENIIIMDALMQAIQPLHPLLYLQYRANRLIDDNASGHGQPDIIEPIEAGTIEVIFSAAYDAERSFKLKNTGSAEIQWTLSDSTTEATNPYQTLAAGATSTLQSLTIADSGDNLIVNNPNDVDIIVELTVTL